MVPPASIKVPDTVTYTKLTHWEIHQMKRLERTMVVPGSEIILY
jgi:hypothetical protein